MSKEYIDRAAIRDLLYKEDAITMKGVAMLNTFPAADVEEKQNWISVDDALPPVYERVLVTNGEFITIDYLCGTVTYNGITGEQEKMTIDWEEYPFYPDNVTHWMHLPEPPGAN